MADKLLRLEEAAQMLGVHPRTLSRHERAGRVCSTRTLGGHRRFPLSVIQAILDGRTDDATRPPAANTED